jgi:glutamate-ammonia-ligase adenylyltransferase
MRLRPTGKSGSLVIPLAEFQRYYEDGGAQLWERQALTRARLVFGDPDFGQAVMEAVVQGAYGLDWRPEIADEILAMRERLEASRSERDLKRGFGGIVDVEFIVQLLQLKYGRDVPAVRSPNTWKGLESLRSTGLLSEADHATLRASYDFLRLVESRLRIVHNRSLDELPESHDDLEILGRRLGCEQFFGLSAAERFLAELERYTQQTRLVFNRLVSQERQRGTTLITASH